jgi:hypothetical protein
MDTGELSVPPISSELPPIERNLNPFLNVNEIMDEVKNERSESMLVDDSIVLPVRETNPFRRLSMERRESETTVTVNEVQENETKGSQDDEMES